MVWHGKSITACEIFIFVNSEYKFFHLSNSFEFELRRFDVPFWGLTGWATYSKFKELCSVYFFSRLLSNPKESQSSMNWFKMLEGKRYISIEFEIWRSQYLQLVCHCMLLNQPKKSIKVLKGFYKMCGILESLILLMPNFRFSCTTYIYILWWVGVCNLWFTFSLFSFFLYLVELCGANISWLGCFKDITEKYRIICTLRQ